MGALPNENDGAGAVDAGAAGAAAGAPPNENVAGAGAGVLSAVDEPAPNLNGTVAAGVGALPNENAPFAVSVVEALRALDVSPPFSFGAEVEASVVVGAVAVVVVPNENPGVDAVDAAAPSSGSNGLGSPLSSR